MLLHSEGSNTYYVDVNTKKCFFKGEPKYFYTSEFKCRLPFTSVVICKYVCVYGYV